jgi:hypothetical protein
MKLGNLNLQELSQNQMLEVSGGGRKGAKKNKAQSGGNSSGGNSSGGNSSGGNSGGGCCCGTPPVSPP